ncbi:MAG TPA: carbohydrate-binding family 9-like protein, partial [Candidatus Polarisedimenticolaceae bacterium]|nr:carbohydrate-binding family 9-like protein [Candidatus Polarisedimenticolaceae bacterium]
ERAAALRVARMTVRLPRIAAEAHTSLAAPSAWGAIPPLGELVDATGGGAPRDRTIVRAATSGRAFHVLFECDDVDVWATHGRRDAPLWEEEVVEVFIAPGRDDPRRYAEIEMSPAGVVFDAMVDNPHGRRDTMRVDVGWTAQGLVGRVSRPRSGRWLAEMAIPWAALADGSPPADVWRANFFRVERPRGAAPEFTAWSPTGATPADFHKPASFGVLVLP